MKKNLILAFLICFFLNALSQKNKTSFAFEYLTTKEGLSHNYVTGLVSDALNIKWIGTENGIAKYNGASFEQIKPSKEFPELLNENIEVLFIDSKFDLWIGTKSGGLSKMNIQTEKIRTYNNIIDLKNEGDLRITALSEDSYGHIWVGTWKNGLFVIDPIENKMVNHYSYNLPVLKIKKDSNGKMWFCVGSRVIIFEPKDNSIKRLIFSNTITDILPDISRNCVWIASSNQDSNLYQYNKTKQKIDTVITNITSQFSKKLSLDKDNRVWLGTWGNGIYRSDREVKTFTKIRLNKNRTLKSQDNYNVILDIHHDKNNMAWISTAHGGVVKLKTNNDFHNLSDYKQKKQLNCTSIYRTKDLFFVGTINGLFAGKSIDKLQEIKGFENHKINTIYEIDNKLYIGTGKIVKIYDPIKKKIVSQNRNIRKATCFLREGNLLFVGTQQNGIYILDLNKPKEFEIYNERKKEPFNLESNRITTIQKDSENNIWIGTYNGLHLYNRKNKSFKHFNKIDNINLPSVIINSICIKGSKIWVATPNGLVKLSYQNEKLNFEKKITKEDGLNSDFICSVTTDSHSNIWMSTHREIVRYNEFNNSLVGFDALDGVKTHSFNNNSIFNFKNRKIYMGGIDNLTLFNPLKLNAERKTPNIVYTNFSVNNKKLQTEKTISYVDKIKLKYDQNTFKISFATNDFLGNTNVLFRYRLNGLNKEWISLKNNNEINFAGLKPGNYKLETQASRDNQNWSKGKKIEISLASSPWLSPWSISFYILIIGLSIYYFIQQNLKKIKLENNLALAQIEKEKEKELTEEKLKFFTNITHEFRTPLTLIVGPVKDLLGLGNQTNEAMAKLQHIDKNANRLLVLINQLLDYRKADAGSMQIKPQKNEIVGLTNEVLKYFEQTAKSKEINLDFTSNIESLAFDFDKNKIEIVLCNLISNAIKYTKEKGIIDIILLSKDDKVTIEIKDNGIGIALEDQEKIFDRFFQGNMQGNNAIGSGIGLAFSKKIIEKHNGKIEVKSKIDKGSSFTITLPLKQRETWEEDINDNDTLASETSELNKLLIVDDNKEIRDYLATSLEKEYQILEAENGKTGIELASKELPDIIISDIMMPVISGTELCKTLKEQTSTSHIPIILLTAKNTSASEIEGLQIGADDYISKPFDTLILRARVQSILNNRIKVQNFYQNKLSNHRVVAEEINLPKTDPFVEKAIQLVEENLNNPDFGIETMVDHLYMSQSTLYRKIKTITGLSLTAFIRSIRIKKAAHLILNTDLNLNEIAYEVGFNDYKYFKTCFKKQFDCLPSKFKEKQSVKPL